MRANSSVGGAGKRLCGGTGQTGPDRMSLSQVIDLLLRFANLNFVM